MHNQSDYILHISQTASALLTVAAYLFLSGRLKLSRQRRILPITAFVLCFIAWQAASLFWNSNISCFRKAKLVTIGTYNTGGLIGKKDIKRGNQYPKSENSLDALAETIRRADADIVALQEVASKQTLQHFLDSRGLSGTYHHVAFEYSNSGYNQHLAFISKYPFSGKPVSHRYHKIPLADGTGCTTFTRDLLRADFNIDGKPGADITVYTTHSKSRKPAAPGQINSDTQRISEAMAIRNIIAEEMKDCPGRLFVLAADLNDDTSNKSVQMILTPKDGGKAWKDSLAILSKDKRSTWPSDPKFSGGFSPAQLDHIIYPAKYINSRKKVKMKDSRVHRYGPSDSLDIPDISAEASDHLMVTADFKIKL